MRLCDGMINITHGDNVIHNFSHHIRVNESRHTQFINGMKKLEKLTILTYYSCLESR